MEQRWSGGGATDVPTAPTTTAATADDGALVPPAGQVVDPAARTRSYDTEIGQGFANLDIPVFGADYAFTVVEGTTAEDLYGNPGHYDDTQYPGELGNFAVAGHRVTKGAPFNALGTLNSCDALVIETQDEWFVYRVLPMADEAAAWNPAARAAVRRRRPAVRRLRRSGRSRDRRSVGLRPGAADPARGRDRPGGVGRRHPAAHHPDHLPPAVLRPPSG